MTEHEKELHAALALLVQKSEHICNDIDDLEYAETAHIANHEAAVGSESWLRTVGEMKAARAALRSDKPICRAAIREAKDTLYTEPQRKTA